MTNDEARFILQAYRPDGRDARDPQFAEALAQVERDPALRDWFREQQSFDGAVATVLGQVPVPGSLRADIIAGRKILRTEVRWTRRAVIGALAACAVALVGLTAVLLGPGRTGEFTAYRSDMVTFVEDVEQGREPLKLTSTDLAAIEDWIAGNSIHQNLELPRVLTAGSGVGCRVRDWNGQSVALACFHLQGGQVAHLLVVNREHVPGGPEAGTPMLASVGRMNTAAWSDGPKTFLLVSRAPMGELEKLL